jgi:hypothetical protein
VELPEFAFALESLIQDAMTTLDADVDEACERMLVTPGDHTVVVYRWSDTGPEGQSFLSQEVRLIPTVPPLEAMTVAQMPWGWRPDSTPILDDGEDG